MTLTIGKAYRLPNGQKGICVLREGETDSYAFSINTGGILDHVYEPASQVTPWREPRTWEVEVRVYENESGNVYQTFSSYDIFKGDPKYKLIARQTVTIKEKT